MIEKWSELAEKLTIDADAKNVPFSGQFELTARCNLSCKMCYVCRPVNDRAALAQELSAKDWIRIAEEAKEAGMFYLLLTGGEVFLRRDFREIYEALSCMGFFITIYTNGTLITKDIARWLGRNPPINMELTLYGASADTYGRVTGHRDAFEKALNGLDLLISEGIDVQLRTTVIRDNAGEYEKFLEIADSRNLLPKFGYYIAESRRDACRCSQDKSMNGGNSYIPDNIRLSPREIALYEIRSGIDYNQRLQKYIETKGIKQFAENRQSNGSENEENGPKNDEIKQENLNNRPNNSKNRPKNVEIGNKNSNNGLAFKCKAGRSEFWITWDGQMSACPFMESFAGRPLEIGFTEAWNRLKQDCSSIPTCDSCEACSMRTYCWTCPARLKMETGSYNKPSNYFCEWAELRKQAFTAKSM